MKYVQYKRKNRNKANLHDPYISDSAVEEAAFTRGIVSNLLESEESKDSDDRLGRDRVNI